MIKQITKPDYSKMGEGELRLLLNKHQQMLNNTRLINSLPDKGQRLRNAINEIEKFLVVPPSPMDCDIITNQFSQMTMSSNDNEVSQEKVHLEKSIKNLIKTTTDNNFSDERLNEVKQRLKARQAERDSKTTVTKTKLISLDEAIQLYNDEKKQAEEHLIQQTTARLLGNMSLSKTTFGLPPTTCKTDLTYRKTTTENDIDDDDDGHIDELGRDKAEIESDHESDEVDYPDDEVENDDD
ncbi:unnamed protein product [Rotaria sordida]|uniref:Uncharacterized protein n=1 Tax=Rotaria sordida TaxID=392033 RepID=A0A813UB45_9BILA|nr:unnamed protein product [Rotaria sordida]CAF0886505.1 unnamed protein product [Rotaria sordida]CAF1075667.1 unnamed protein product [Rotaria sordida]CAF1092522.1 unnamed protein product [Rotaria sordida]CAF1097441.1 unnamed protein product [Rotaria sordida]